LSENNYYDGVRSPVVTEAGGIMRTSGNIYDNCTGEIDPGTDTVFTPPYPYSPDAASDVPYNVKTRAGAF
jgi:hypothetical protein